MGAGGIIGSSNSCSQLSTTANRANPIEPSGTATDAGLRQKQASLSVVTRTCLVTPEPFSHLLFEAKLEFNFWKRGQKPQVNGKNADWLASQLNPLECPGSCRAEHGARVVANSPLSRLPVVQIVDTPMSKWKPTKPR